MAVEVTESSFAVDVLDRSRTLPVVVDFWAAWCGPCRALGPVLEEAVAARAGLLELAKVDVDTNPGLQRAFGVRGIPAVKAFRDGTVVAEFTGALPRASVDRWLDGLLPSPAETLVAAGDEASLRRAVDSDPGHAGARVALGRVLLARGDVAAAEEVLLPVEHDPQAAGLLAALELRRAADAGPAAREAVEALGRGDLPAALDALVATVRGGPAEPRELARRVAVGVFAELGDADPLVQRFRPALAAALY
ncbi:MAG TPA: tetratricopeptide repeat protein [Candidatus Dormibacteraeota bacterium]|nr:tetratricopeptide repeat protein [Candidatus Dormibacteraeota bacterium]